jgi:hypothetical protein
MLAVDADGDKIQLVLAGEGELPNSTVIVHELRQIMGDEPEITARIVGMRKEIISGNDSVPLEGAPVS